MTVKRPDGRERRREPRYKVNLPVTYIRGALRCDGMCLDLSFQGMLVELSSEVEGAEGELVRVEVAAPDELPRVLPTVITRRIGRKIGLLLFGVSGDPERIWRALVSREIKKREAAEAEAERIAREG